MSSTVIIVKILYDKRELETLAGRVTLGVLVLQDIATILFLAVQPNLKTPSAGVMVVAVWPCHPAAGGGVSGKPVRPAARFQVHRAPAGTGAGRRAGLVFRAGGLCGSSQALLGDGRAHRGRDDLHVSLHARCRGESHEPPRFFCDAVFRRPRHDHSGADGGLHFVDVFPLPGACRQPARHGFPRVVFNAAGLSRQPAAGDQSVPDERTLARAA